MSDNGAAAIKCRHLDLELNQTLGTMKCKDCGLVRRVSPVEAVQLQLLDDVGKYVRAALPIIEKLDLTSQEQVLALLGMSVVILRDNFSITPENLQFACLTFYTHAELGRETE